MWRETTFGTVRVKSSAHFNPLPPCGGRPTRAQEPTAGKHFNPLPPCGGRLLPEHSAKHLHSISIHSLRVEGDTLNYSFSTFTTRFQSTPSVWRETITHHLRRGSDSISIHSLRVEGDPLLELPKRWMAKRFQSTPSVWRETAYGSISKRAAGHFNPLPPCGGRQDCHSI